MSTAPLPFPTPDRPFGTLLRHYREAAVLSQEALAERAGMSARAIRYLERGSSRPYPDTLRRLAAALALTPAQHEALVAAAHTPGVPAPQPESAASVAMPRSFPLPPAPMLVGREQELAMLRGCLTASLAGQGGLVLLGGEAGVGKTALAEAQCWEAAQQGARVLVGRCYDLSETPPYGPWTDALSQFPPTPDLPPLPSALHTAARSSLEFFAEVRAFITDAAKQQPMLVFLDDMQWADPASLDLLRFLARSLATLPLLLIATYRSEDLDHQHPFAQRIPLLVREARAERLDLAPLSAQALHLLVQRRYRLDAADADKLVAYFARRTAGNALFATEMLRALEERGIVTADSVALGDLDTVAVPPLLRQIVMGRVARLGADAERLLGVAAVIGQEVALDVWMQVGEADDETVETVAEQALAVRLLIATREGVAFAHALIREALYEALPAMRRRRLHRAVGEALAAGTDPTPDVVAYHFREAGDPRAAMWLVLAGERAEDAYALVTAEERYESAIALLDAQRGDPSERGWLRLLLASLRRYREPDRALRWVAEAMQLAREAGDASLVARAQVMHGLLVGYRGEHRTSMADLAALDVIERLPPGTGAARRREQLIDAMVNRGTLTNNLAHFGYLTEAREQAERYLAQTGASASTPTEVGALAGIYGALSVAYALQGEPAHSQQSYAACIAARETIGDYRSVLAKQREELALVVLPYQADDLVERARVADAAEHTAFRLIQTGALRDIDDPQFVRLPLLALEGRWREARHMAELTDTSYIATLLHLPDFVLGTLARAQGEAETAWRCVRETWPDGPTTEPGTRYVAFTVPLLLLAAALALDVGDLPTARIWLDAHRHWLDFMDSTRGHAEGAVVEAAWHRVAGDADRARAYAEQALRSASDPRQPLALLAAHRLFGELDADAGRHTEADEHLATALALADACRAPYERALTLLARAALDATSGNTARARATLDTVRAICAPLGAGPALAHAAALAATLPSKRGQG